MKNTGTQSNLPAAREDYLDAIRDGMDAGDDDDKDIVSSNVTLKAAADKYQALLDIHLINSEKALSHIGPPKSA